MSRSEFKTDSEVKTSSKYDSRREYKAYREGYSKSDLSSMDSSDVDSMIDDMSYRELRAFKKSLGIKGKGNTKASLKRSIKAELKKSEDLESQKRVEVSDVDQRGFRGNHAENQVIDSHNKEGWVVKDRPSKGHDIVFKKDKEERYYDVKEINESVDSGKGIEKGRVQIDKKELQKIKNWEKQSPKTGKANVIIKINLKDSGKSEWKLLTPEKASQLMKGKKDPVKIPFSEIEKLPDFKDVDLPKEETFQSGSIETETQSETETETQSETETETEEYIHKTQVVLEQSEKPNQFSYSENIIQPKNYASFPSGGDWKDKKAIHEDRRKEYIRKDLIPILHPQRKEKTGMKPSRKPSNEIVDVKELKYAISMGSVYS